MNATIQQNPNTREYHDGEFATRDVRPDRPKCWMCAFNKDAFRCADSPCSPMARHGDAGRLDQRNVVWVRAA